MRKWLMARAGAWNVLTGLPGLCGRSHLNNNKVNHRGCVPTRGPGGLAGRRLRSAPHQVGGPAGAPRVWAHVSPSHVGRRPHRCAPGPSPGRPARAPTGLLVHRAAGRSASVSHSGAVSPGGCPASAEGRLCRGRPARPQLCASVLAREGHSERDSGCSDPRGLVGPAAPEPRRRQLS